MTTRTPPRTAAMTTPTQPAEPGTEAGRRLLAGLLDYDALPPDRMSWNRDAILAIEAEASRDAAARVEGFPRTGGPDTALARVIQATLADLYEPGGQDQIAAMRIARVVEDAGWRRITKARVRAAMESVANLAIEAYEPTVTELTSALAAVPRAARAAAAAPQPARETEAAGDAG